MPERVSVIEPTSRTSSRWGCTVRPRDCASEARSSASASVRTVGTTTAPVSASRTVSSRPIPFDAPVTTTTRPRRSKRPVALTADWRTQLETVEICSDTITISVVSLSCVGRTSDQKPLHAAFKVPELGAASRSVLNQAHCQLGCRNEFFGQWPNRQGSRPEIEPQLEIGSRYELEHWRNRLFAQLEDN